MSDFPLISTVPIENFHRMRMGFILSYFLKYPEFLSSLMQENDPAQQDETILQESLRRRRVKDTNLPGAY